nr:MAG TPA: hypothetical protein [Bacteriophage sp.]DAT49600.1 MAG TPA: hypothetical protein [Caudoviricetes sp.]
MILFLSVAKKGYFIYNRKNKTERSLRNAYI